MAKATSNGKDALAVVYWATCPEVYEQNDEDVKSQIVSKFHVESGFC